MYERIAPRSRKQMLSLLQLLETAPAFVLVGFLRGGIFVYQIVLTRELRRIA
jgi:hypothetical protein